ncbi:hypothetical protein K491DRAFT_606158 [Lophiostoma macrostomum CBS 122681]|uniref:Carrier domain-containing protein n=1 Tax=Lophiostoma macrostomum CBS 122681 TaxID=1314788 RepID=A0A6A6SYZ8_9PLEO|nr:hypothetical protein K491DRAFT_606158 [Lophiostoma macrostomum CBS 122681]
MNCQTSIPPTNHLVERNVFMVGLGSSLPLTNSRNRAVWKRDRRMGIYHNTTKSGPTNKTESSNAGLEAYISNAKRDPDMLRSAGASSFFAMEIGKRLFDLLLKPGEEVNMNLPLVDLGMDSLVGIELRSWWNMVFGFDISVLEMLGMGSLEALGEHAAKGILGRIKVRE